MHPKMIFVALTILMAGCTTHLAKVSPSTIPSTHVLLKPYNPAVEGGLFHLSCTDKYPDGHSAYAQFDGDKAEVGRVELARRHFIHAAMANNSYSDPKNKPIFVLPGWTLHDALESKSGLALQVYGDGVSLKNSERVVVAYRGTNSSSVLDWANNLSPMEPLQYRQAFSHLKELKSNYPEAKVTAVGHSLGGGIAMNMSMRLPGVDAVAFNMSPRVRFGRTEAYPAYRASLYEVGEILTGGTNFYSAFQLPDSVHYGNYNFLDYRAWTFSPVPEHGIYELTRALTVVAMTRGSGEAITFFTANIGEDQARRTDWEHCEALFQ